MRSMLRGVVLALAAICTAACQGESAPSTGTTVKPTASAAIANSGLANPIDPCLFVSIEEANRIKGPSVPHIIMVNDSQGKTRKAPVRKCISNEDQGNRLTVTTLIDKPNDDTGYNALASLYLSKQDRNNVQGPYKIYSIVEDGGTTGVVFKTPKNVAIAIKFGSPVTEVAGLTNMVNEAVKVEPTLFAVFMP